MRSIVDRQNFPPYKFAGLPQSAPKTRVVSYGFMKQILTQILIDHMIV